MKKSVIVSMALLGVLAAAPVFAADLGNAEQRDVNQQERIQQGVQSGELTNHEAATLEHGQARVDNAEAKAAADGHVTKAEARHINRMQNRQSARIHHKKHNVRTAPGAQ